MRSVASPTKRPKKALPRRMGWSRHRYLGADERCFGGTRQRVQVIEKFVAPLVAGLTKQLPEKPSPIGFGSSAPKPATKTRPEMLTLTILKLVSLRVIDLHCLSRAFRRPCLAGSANKPPTAPVWMAFCRAHGWGQFWFFYWFLCQPDASFLFWMIKRGIYVARNSNSIAALVLQVHRRLGSS